MTFTPGSTGGKYTIDLKHYHHAPTGYDGNNYYMGRIDGAGPDYVETDTSLGYAFSGGSSSASSTRHFGTSYSLDKKNIQSPYVTVYFWRRTA